MTFIRRICQNFKIVTAIALYFNTATFFCIRYVFSFDCCTIVNNAHKCFINVIEFRNVDLFTLFSSRCRFLVVSKMEHVRKFLEAAKIALFLAIFIGEYTTNLSVFLAEK